MKFVLSRPFTDPDIAARKLAFDGSQQPVARQRLGLRQIYTRPYTPKTNGKAERFIQTMLREWAYLRPYPSSAVRRRQLPRWLVYYNARRPHGSLDGVPPLNRLLQAVNNLPGFHS